MTYLLFFLSEISFIGSHVLNLVHRSGFRKISGATKRQILKMVMSIFDPLRLIVNLPICGRILIQDIWKTGIGCDDATDDELYHTWKLFLTDFEQISNVSILMCYSLRVPFAERLVAYLRTVTQESKDVSLVLVRARVAPKKPIPRLSSKLL